MDELMEFVCLWVRNQRYGIRKGSSCTSKNFYILCDCGSSYGGRLKNIAKRNTSTHKCECPFYVRGSTSRDKSSTNQPCSLVVKHGEPPGIPLSFRSPFLPTTSHLTS
ncbi:uncharacterized protein VP01_4190g1 [Puccinia sorghi]|uniref:Uncharacterized protein n=1 Tax=Puccinia sorghi TaxID=27349 RepID=A0A0L6UQT4_9BASI|nr:uncharacterized protein VP01_4190g1 [Puccinia sorghi]